MIRKNELSFVGGPAEWVIAKQREDARRVATAQRRKGYTSGWYPNAAVATEAMLRAPPTDAVPLSVEAVEWVLSEQPGQRMSVSALNDVFQTHTKAERERLASLVAEVCTVVRLPDERGSGAGRRNASCDLVMLKGRGSRPASQPASPAVRGGARGGGGRLAAPPWAYVGSEVPPSPDRRRPEPTAAGGAKAAAGATPVEAFLLAQLWRKAGVPPPPPGIGVDSPPGGGGGGGSGGSLLPVERLSAAFSEADEACRRRLAAVLTELA